MDTVISSPDLCNQLGSSRSPLILDVRRREAFEQDARMLPGALYRAPDEIAAWAGRLPSGQSIVVYCVHGREVSQGAARALRDLGHDACYLEGGIAAWRAAGAPTLRKLGVQPCAGASRWVTRERPKIDRIACPWLVRRFIDPLAQFLYVPADQVLQAAQQHSAIAYDVPGVTFSHRGERCSFDALVEDFDLHDAALDRLARIVRGADTDRLDLAPQCAGLLALSLGLSASHGDDLVMLEHGMTLYDALYAWCRLDTAGSSERHNWSYPS
jgi:rhodanese-related sulfurtransferase